MNHHAYVVTGEVGKGKEAALAYGERVLRHTPGSTDVLVIESASFSVEDARALIATAARTATNEKGRLIIIAVSRIFHEAQNALLKLFEEPPVGVTLILVVPSLGSLIPTLRSRLQPLPEERKQKTENTTIYSSAGDEFLRATPAAREKIVAKILERAKKDAPEEKQAARAEALALAEDITRAAYARYRTNPTPALQTLLKDLNRLLPVLHERSAPLKPILEHIHITSGQKS